MDKTLKTKSIITIIVAILFAVFFGAFFKFDKTTVLADDSVQIAVLLDEQGGEKHTFENFDDIFTFDNILPTDTVLLKVSEIICYDPIMVNGNISITSNTKTKIYIETSTLFSIENTSTLNLENIDFSAFSNSIETIMTVDATSTLTLTNCSFSSISTEKIISNSGNTTLNDNSIQNVTANFLINNNGNLAINNSLVQNNFCENIISNFGSLTISNSSISNNLIESNGEYSTIYSLNDLVIDGNNGNLNIKIKLDRNLTYPNYPKIIRTNSDEISSNNTSTIYINLDYPSDFFTVGDIVASTIDDDSITYILDTPLKLESGFDAYYLSNENNNLVVRGTLLSVEFYTLEKTGYKNDFSKNTLYEFGTELLIEPSQKINATFVGWFGYNGQNYYGNDNVLYSNITNSNLNNLSAISKIIPTTNAIYFNEPIIQNESYIFGKISLYEKWKATLNITIESENIDGKFSVSDDGGTLGFNNTEIGSEQFNTTVVIPEALSLSAKANDSYTFIGWFTKDLNNEYLVYNLENYKYNKSQNLVTLNIESIYFDELNLVARFSYKSCSIAIKKVLIGENNNQEPLSIEKDNEYLINASLMKDESTLNGIDKLNYIGSNIVLKNDFTLYLQINPDINYHIDKNTNIAIKNILSNETIEVTYGLVDNKYILTINPNEKCGIFEIVLYFRKNYNTITLYYGQNFECNDFYGGNTDFDTTYSDGEKIYGVFNPVTNYKSDSKILSKTANVYLATSAYININVDKNYRFEPFKTSVLFGDEEMPYTYVYNGNEITGLIVENIVTDITIVLGYTKILSVNVKISNVSYNNTTARINKIILDQTENHTSGFSKHIDAEDTIVLTTTQEAFLDSHSFRHWKITYENGAEIDYLNWGILEDDLKSTTIIIHNISDIINIEAVYGKKIIKVSILWDGQNGKVNSPNYSSEYDVFSVEYNNNISIKFTPDSNKYYIDRLIFDENIAVKQTDNDVITLTYNNLKENQTIEVTFLPITIWKFLNIHDFEGDGTIENPYKIHDLNELSLISYFINNGIDESENKVPYAKAHYSLQNSIDATFEYYFVPIGNAEHPFEGVFNFNYHSIENITTENSDNTYKCNGLFNVLSDNAKIIRQRRLKLFYGLGLTIILVIITVSIVVVCKIEKEHQKPKKVFVLVDAESYKRFKNK